MYKVMLVEDEAVVRQGIVKKIDWQAHGFILSGVYEDGRQALEAFKETPAHVVITDINMPFLDGLELAKIIRELRPDTAVVLLTGYGEFAYAKRAIEYRVHSYILKPVTARELCQLLDQLHSELDEQKKLEQNQRDIMEEMSLLRHGALEQLACEGIDEGGKLVSSGSRQAAQAVEYLRGNYTDPKLSLQTITALLSVSTSYFNNLFKNYTGETFIKYLTRLRMEKAKELLIATDLKNYEIAERVGYDDPGYFGSAFKKFCGMKPSEFRKRQGKSR